MTDEVCARARATPRIRVLIAEDHALFRGALAALLVSMGHEVVGAAVDGGGVVAGANTLKPDLVIMDMSLPDMAGDVATRLVLAANAAIGVVALSAYGEPEWVEAALDAGASAYVLKDLAFEELPAAIEAALSGELYVSGQVVGGLRESLRERIASR